MSSILPDADFACISKSGAASSLHLAGAVELRNAVISKYGIDLPATVTFDYPTISALASYITAKLAPALAGGMENISSGTWPVPNTAADAFKASVTEIVGISSSIAASGQRDRGKVDSNVDSLQPCI